MKPAKRRVESACALGCIALVMTTCFAAGRLSAQAATVPATDARNINIVTTNTHLPLPAFTSLKAWEARKAFLRNQILVSTGLSPMPEKAPLHPQIFGKIEGANYTIEKCSSKHCGFLSRRQSLPSARRSRQTSRHPQPARSLAIRPARKRTD